VTESPTFTVIVAGAKAKFWIVTAEPAAAGLLPDVVADGAGVAGALDAGAGVGVEELEHAPRATAPTSIISRIGRCTIVLRLVVISR
jgi:hypothetical protein